VTSSLLGTNIFLRCQYSASDVILRCQYSASDVILRCQYSASDAILRCQYSASDVTLRCQYSASDVTLRCQYSASKQATAFFHPVTTSLCSAARHPFQRYIVRLTADVVYSKQTNEQTNVHREASGRAASQDVPHLLYDPKAHYRANKSVRLVSTLSHASPVYTLTPNLKSSVHLCLGHSKQRLVCRVPFLSPYLTHFWPVSLSSFNVPVNFPR
jgi:hypothetical protein